VSHPEEKPEEKTHEQKLQELRDAKRRIEQSRAAAAKARELEVLELEVRFEAEIGPRGSQFEIVETIDGPIVVRLGEGVLYTRFTASKVTDVDVHEFVDPCVVHPAKEKYREIAMQRPDVPARVAHALATLYGARHKDDAGKF